MRISRTTNTSSNSLSASKCCIWVRPKGHSGAQAVVNLFASVDILATFLFAMGNKITGRAYPTEGHFAWNTLKSATWRENMRSFAPVMLDMKHAGYESIIHQAFSRLFPPNKSFFEQIMIRSRKDNVLFITSSHPSSLLKIDQILQMRNVRLAHRAQGRNRERGMSIRGGINIPEARSTYFSECQHFNKAPTTPGDLGQVTFIFSLFLPSLPSLPG